MYMPQNLVKVVNSLITHVIVRITSKSGGEAVLLYIRVGLPKALAACGCKYRGSQIHRP